MTIYRSCILKIRMFQTRFVEKIKTHILCSMTFFFGNRTVYEIMWKNIASPERPQMTIWQCARTLHAGYQRLHKHTHTHTQTHTHTHTHREYVILTAFIPQRLLLPLPVFFFRPGSFCHTYPTNALEVLIYVALLSFFRLMPIPHYCILSKNISVLELLIWPIVLRCMAPVLFPPHSFGRPSYCIIGSSNFNKSKLTSVHTVVYENRSVGTVRSKC